jgi:hypothetical protein
MTPPSTPDKLSLRPVGRPTCAVAAHSGEARGVCRQPRQALDVSWSLCRCITDNILKIGSFLFRYIQFVWWHKTENPTSPTAAVRGAITCRGSGIIGVHNPGLSGKLIAIFSDHCKKWPVFVLIFLRIKNGIITVVLANSLEVNNFYHKILYRKPKIKNKQT